MTTQKSYYGPAGPLTFVVAVPTGWVLYPGYDYLVDSMIDPRPSFEAQYPSVASLLEAMDPTGQPGTSGILFLDRVSASAGHYLLGEATFGPGFSSVDREAKSLLAPLASEDGVPVSALTWSPFSTSAGPAFKISWAFTGTGPGNAVGRWPSPKGAKIHHVLYEFSTSSDLSCRLDFQFDDEAWQAYSPLMDKVARSLRVVTPDS